MIELAVFALAALVSAASVRLIRALAWRNNVLDVPNHRSSHDAPTPRGGGLAIAALVLLGALVIAPGDPALSWPLIAYAVGGALVSLVGLADDVRTLPSRVRFVAQALAATVLVIAAGYWSVVGVPLVGVLDLGYLGLAVTLVWIVGLTNAYNFMDGIDGIAGGQAVDAGLGWAALGSLSGQPRIAAIGLLVAGSSLGFLRHNWPKASIFMGDVGSGFLGFTFAALAILGAASDPRLSFAGALLVWPFIFDACFTFARRARRGEDVFSAHRSHLYQRLVVAGQSHRAVATLYVALAAVGCGLSIFWVLDERLGGLAVVAILPTLAVLLCRYVTSEERRVSAVERSADRQPTPS